MIQQIRSALIGHGPIIQLILPTQRTFRAAWSSLGLGRVPKCRESAPSPHGGRAVFKLFVFKGFWIVDANRRAAPEWRLLAATTASIAFSWNSRLLIANPILNCTYKPHNLHGRGFSLGFRPHPNLLPVGEGTFADTLLGGHA